MILPVSYTHLEHNKIEVTTFRLDGNYSDFRRPDEVELTNLETIDVKRRDFTVNGLLMDENYKVYDLSLIHIFLEWLKEFIR